MKKRFLQIILLLLVLPFTAFSFYGNWYATDSASEYGYSSVDFPGTDSPGNRNCSVGLAFAPNRGRHDSYLYDNGTYDYVKENYISWSSASINWFSQNPQYNWVHQVLESPKNIHKPTTYLSTNLPGISHFDIDPQWEVDIQGYEEVEIGTLYPEYFVANRDYNIATEWRTITPNPSSTSGQFISESELTYTLIDPWQPECQQGVGIINFISTNEDRWYFETANNRRGWGNYNTSASNVTGGKLVIDPSGTDPYITSPPLLLPASKYKTVLLRMASNLKDGYGKVYFKTSNENSYSESKTVPFTVQNCNLCGNASYKSYLLYMPTNSKWTGNITEIRIDPGNNGQSGTNRDSVGFDLIAILEQ